VYRLSSEIPCAFSVARFIPDLVRNEPINIGIVLCSVEHGIFEASFLQNLRSKLPKSVKPSQLLMVEETISSFHEALQKVRHNSDLQKKLIEDLPRKYSGLLQFGPTLAVMTDEPKSEVASLFSRYVAVPHHGSMSESSQRGSTRREITAYFQECGFMGNRQSHVNLKPKLKVDGSDSGAVYKMDYAYANGRVVAVDLLDLDLSLAACQRHAYSTAIKIPDLKKGLKKRFFGCTLVKMPSDDVERKEKLPLIKILKNYCDVFRYDIPKERRSFAEVLKEQLLLSE
jgi:hypothetical protein